MSTKYILSKAAISACLAFFLSTNYVSAAVGGELLPSSCNDIELPQTTCPKAIASSDISLNDLDPNVIREEILMRVPIRTVLDYEQTSKKSLSFLDQNRFWQLYVARHVKGMPPEVVSQRNVDWRQWLKEPIEFRVSSFWDFQGYEAANSVDRLTFTYSSRAEPLHIALQHTDSKTHNQRAFLYRDSCEDEVPEIRIAKGNFPLVLELKLISTWDEPDPRTEIQVLERASYALKDVWRFIESTRRVEAFRIVHKDSKHGHRGRIQHRRTKL